MLPPEPRQDTVSAAERDVFAWIEKDLSSEWIGLHSVGQTNHPYKIWAEIDFVLIGPPGVFCLEVKGGRVEYYGGRWYFTNRRGETNDKGEGPFQQAGSAAGALSKHLRAKLGHLTDLCVGYGVVTPDMVFDRRGSDHEQAVVFDQRDLGTSFMAYVRRLVDHWHGSMESRGRRPMLLESAQRKEILEQIRGDFDARPSLKSRIDRANSELHSLTQKQCEILDGLSDNERVVIRGGAGTGKTFLAVEEAFRHSRCGHKVFLTCFNKQLAAELSKIFEEEENVTVAHLHGYLADKVREANLTGQLPVPAPSVEDLMNVFYPELAEQALTELDELESFDVLIVDEGQDLLQRSYLSFFDVLVKGGLKNGRWMVLFDPNQDVYRRSGSDAIADLKTYGPAGYRLTVNCRNTQPIAVENQILTGLCREEVVKVDGPGVEEIWVRDEPHRTRELVKCLNRLTGIGLKPEGIVVLGRRDFRKSGLEGHLTGLTLRLSDIPEAVGAGRAIRYSTIAGFKGLEAEAVVVDIQSLDETELPLLYVALSRPKTYLAIILNEHMRGEYDAAAFRFGQSLAEVRS